MCEKILEVQNLETRFARDSGSFAAVDGLSFDLHAGETLAIVGESGCGKSVTSLSLIGLVPPPGRVTGGRVLLRGDDLLGKTPHQLRAVRGREIAMIFQEPTASLNPAFKVGRQIADVLVYHQHLSRSAARARAEELLAQVGIADPAAIAGRYPHQLSGGMCQRVMIAMALSLGPRVLIADEPTTSLDVTIQAQILRLLRDLRQATGTAVLLITHDMGVVAQVADRVLVMYAGQAVEQADVHTLFSRPRHPYTQGLLRAMPGSGEPGSPLVSIPGLVPAAGEYPPGCRFAPRCVHADEGCQSPPPLREYEAGHAVRCIRCEEVQP